MLELERYPQVYIGVDLPKGWFEEYQTFLPASIQELREVVASLSGLSADMVVGIDLRPLGVNGQQAVLKFLEESKLKVILRIEEPVQGTVLSRAAVVYKKEKVEVRSVVEGMLSGATKVEQKVIGLK